MLSPVGAVHVDTLMLFSRPILEILHTEHPVSAWQIDRGDIELGPKIARGSFGSVFRACWLGTVTPGLSCSHAGLKTERPASRIHPHGVLGSSALQTRLRVVSPLTPLQACAVKQIDVCSLQVRQHKP